MHAALIDRRLERLEHDSKNRTHLRRPLDYPRSTERYLTIVKLSDFGAERAPAELAAIITSV